MMAARRPARGVWPRSIAVEGKQPETMSPPPPPRFSVVFVVGVARCGSTLLGRLLDMHSRILCVGEILRTDLALETELPCGCGAKIPECPFWKPLLPALQRETKLAARRFRADTFRKLARAHGREVLVDLSKTRAWRLARRWKDADVGFVFLIRDSRGVMASTARGGKDIDHPLRRHRKWMRRFQRFARKRGERCLTLHYEDLCRAPRAELEKVSGFLGLEFEPAMLRPAEKDHHFVHSSTSGYLKASNEIRLDERWREELPAEAIREVERVMRKLPCFEGRVDGVRAPIGEGAAPS